MAAGLRRSAARGVHVWDLRRGEEVAAGAAGHQGVIGQIAVSRAGLIATASDDHTVRLWDAATGKEQQCLQHGHWVRSVALSPDARLLASSSLDDFVHLWDLQSGKEIHKLRGHGRLADIGPSAFTRRPTLPLLGRRSRTAPMGRQNRQGGFRNHVQPAGAKVVTKNVKKVQQKSMRAAYGRPGRVHRGRQAPHCHDRSGPLTSLIPPPAACEHSLTHPGGSYISSLAVAPDGKLFATSGWGKPIVTKLPDGRSRSSTTQSPPRLPGRSGDRQTGSRARDADDAMPAPVAFSADGKLLAIGFGRGRGEVRVLEVATQKMVAALKDIDSGPHAMTFSPDGKYLVTGLHNQTTLVWDLAHVLAKKTKEER